MGYAERTYINDAAWLRPVCGDGREAEEGRAEGFCCGFRI